MVAFTRASDAVACALALQQAALAPTRLRIGVHTSEVQLRDEGKYMGPTINRAARLRELGHGGQTLLSGTTSDLVCERMPEHAWLIDFGRRTLRDLSRPERVTQLCHPDLHNEFPPLRTRSTNVRRRPVQLDNIRGRVSEPPKSGDFWMSAVRRWLAVASRPAGVSGARADVVVVSMSWSAMLAMYPSLG